MKGALESRQFMKEQRSISVSLFCIELLTWAGVNGNDIREREGNEKKTFPKFRNGKGTKKSIPKIQEREGNEKNIPKIHEREGNEENPFQYFRNGNKRPSFPGVPRNGNGNGKKNKII